jgi:glycosyltransferase involved in cell wall biosynthesis
MVNNMRVLLVEDKHAHFGNHSGYGNIFRYLEKTDAVRFLRPATVGRLESKFFERLLRQDYAKTKYGPHHHFGKYMEEYFAFRQLRSLKPDIIHFPFAEDCLGFFSDNKSRLPKCTKMVGTIHQPPSWWKMTKKNPSVLSCLDALIVLSTEAKVYFEKFLPGRVHFIPHAVDCEFFQPKEANEFLEDHIQFLFVGSWLRDFIQVVKAAEFLSTTAINVHFNLVYPAVPESNHPLFQLLKLKSVTWHRDISDGDLRDLYQKADLLYLPLIDCTANNALLEAAACGTPIITNNCGGLRDYFRDNLLVIEDGSNEETLHLFNQFLEGSSRTLIREKARNLAREVKEKLDVSVISAKIIDLYRSL